MSRGLKEGDVLVDSELLMPARPDLGVGEQTRTIATVQSARPATMIEYNICRSSASSPPRLRGFDGTTLENGEETALPAVATIGLAGTIFLDFRKRL